MVELLLKRYLWLIDTLKDGSEMSYDEIANRWKYASVNDNGSVLTKRTFYNHCQAIARHFGIDIECRRGRGLNLYRIVNIDALEENSLTKWVLNNFSLGEMLLGNTAIADKILLEDIPSGYEWLEPILQALRQNLEINIAYENFVKVKFIGRVRPLCVKLFKRRWYLLSLLENGKTRIFSLDRIHNLTLTDQSFVYPENFFPADYFHDFFGIITKATYRVESIIIRTYAELPEYLRSLPLHHSQYELRSTPTYTDFSLRLVPTFDFIQELLLHGEQLEVILPIDLREKVSEIISKMRNLYDYNFFSGYEIDGNASELVNIINSNASIQVTRRDVNAALSTDKTNYIRTGYGETLENAYQVEPPEGTTCKLVHIYSRPGKINISEFNDFITGLGSNIIFGYTKDEMMTDGVKLVMIFN